MKRYGLKDFGQQYFLKWANGTLSVRKSGNIVVAVYPSPKRFFTAVLKDIQAKKKGAPMTPNSRSEKRKGKYVVHKDHGGELTDCGISSWNLTEFWIKTTCKNCRRKLVNRRKS